LVKATGTLGPNANEMLDELTQRKVLSREDLAKINRITFAQSPVASWPQNRTPLPALMLHSDDANVLEKIAAAIPAILELLGGAKADAIVETINGVKIRSLEARASPTGQSFHYGWHGNALAVGTDRKAIADALQSQANSNGITASKELKKPAMVCVWNWVDSIRGTTPARKLDSGPRRGTAYGQFPQSASPYSPYFPSEMRPNAFRLTREALDQYEGLPPLVLAISRHGNALLIDIQQTDPRRIRTKGISHLFEWYVRVSSSRSGSIDYNIIDGPIDLLPILPPPPLPPNP
jgi:hypothetical protein